ncbi:MAG: hypothetical protein WC796_03455 [Candidatus Pacearchaeota archaeon]|jgi:hypothetical protein
MKEGGFFTAHPEKAKSKIAINSFMMGSLFFILTLILATDPSKFGIVVITELVLAIPFLYVSSLAYTKITYRSEAKLWDGFGWFTNNIGNLFVLNVVGLITAEFFRNLALIYFGLIIVLFVIYSFINFIYHPKKIGQKLFKLLFLIVIIVLGGILPTLLNNL